MQIKDLILEALEDEDVRKALSDAVHDPYKMRRIGLMPEQFKDWPLPSDPKQNQEQDDES